MTAAPGGAVFQVAYHRFHLDPGPAETADALGILVQRAAHTLPVHRHATYAVHRHDEGYRIVEDDDDLAVVATPAAVLEAVYGRVAARAVELACRLGWTRLHAGTVDVAGRRLLLVGDSGTGKTTLTLALGAAGGQVQGDEITLVRDGASVALARRFHCKPGTEDALPALAAALDASPRAEHDGEEIRALDPSELGWPWELDVRPVDAVVLLAPERAATPALARVASPVALGVLLGAALRLVETDASVRRQCVRLLARPAWSLRSGRVDETADALATLAASL